MFVKTWEWDIISLAPNACFISLINLYFMFVKTREWDIISLAPNVCFISLINLCYEAKAFENYRDTIYHFLFSCHGFLKSVWISLFSLLISLFSFCKHNEVTFFGLTGLLTIWFSGFSSTEYQLLWFPYI